MKFPLNEVLCIVVGVLISGVFSYISEGFVKKHNLGTVRLMKFLQFLPDWLGGIIVVLLFIPFAVFVFLRFSWAFYACNFIIDNNNIKNAVFCLILNIFGCFYSSALTKDMPERRKWHY